MALTLNTVLFYLLAAMAVGSAIGVISARNPVKSALSLVITLFSIAGLYLLLNAQFLAVIQVLTYAGAILVLFVFIIMLLNLDEDHLNEQKMGPVGKFILVMTASVLLLALVLIVFIPPASEITLAPGYGDIFSLGRMLFTSYALPFEIAGVLLTVALIGAVLLAKKNLVEEQK